LAKIQIEGRDHLCREGKAVELGNRTHGLTGEKTRGRFRLQKRKLSVFENFGVGGDYFDHKD